MIFFPDNLLTRIWEGIRGNHSVYCKRLGLAGVVVGADSLYSLEPLRRLIGQHLSTERLQSSRRDFKVGTVSLVTGQYEEWPATDPNFVEKLVASTAIPVVFPFVDLKRDRDVLVDGGVRNMTPLASALRAGADQIYVLLTSKVTRKNGVIPQCAAMEEDYEQWDDNWLGTKVNGLDVLVRSLDLIMDEVYLDDIRGALKWNAIVRKIDHLSSAARKHELPDPVAAAVADLTDALERIGRRSVEINVIAPQEWYGDDNSSTEFKPSLIQRAINHGRELAADRKRWLWPP